MYKFFSLVVCGLVMSLGLVGQVYAAGLTYRSFGGRIVLPQIPDITCVGQYWFSYTSTRGKTNIMPYLVRATQRTVTPGGQVLGVYASIQDAESCYTGDTGAPTPVPVLRVYPHLFNTSIY